MKEHKNHSWIDALLSQVEEKTGLILVDVLGCAHYGCVFSTDKDETVVKITSDLSEVAIIKMVKQIRKKGKKLEGFVGYYDIFEFKTPDLLSGKAYAIVRDEITPVDRIADRSLLKYVNDYKELAGKYQFASEYDRKKITAKIESTLSAMRNLTDLAKIAESLETVYKETGYWLGDIHGGNVGWVNSGLAIFDPGHTKFDDTWWKKLKFDKATLSSIVNSITEDISVSSVEYEEQVEMAEDMVGRYNPFPNIADLPKFPRTKNQIGITKKMVEFIQAVLPLADNASDIEFPIWVDRGEEQNIPQALSAYIEELLLMERDPENEEPVELPVSYSTDIAPIPSSVDEWQTVWDYLNALEKMIPKGKQSELPEVETIDEFQAPMQAIASLAYQSLENAVKYRLLLNTDLFND